MVKEPGRHVSDLFITLSPCAIFFDLVIQYISKRSISRLLHNKYRPITCQAATLYAAQKPRSRDLFAFFVLVVLQAASVLATRLAEKQSSVISFDQEYASH